MEFHPCNVLTAHELEYDYNNSLVFSVTKTIPTTVGFLHGITLLSDNIVAIFGAESSGLKNLIRHWARDWMLQLYHLEKENQICCIHLQDHPESVAVVKLAGIQRLALAYSYVY